MTKIELIKELSKATGFKYKKVRTIIDSFANNIRTNLIKGEKISLRNWGYFKLNKRQSRNSFNPFTKKHEVFPPSVLPVFRFSKLFKNNIND